MSWLRRLFSSRIESSSVRKIETSDVVVKVSKLPTGEVDSVMSDLTSMLGVSRVIAFNKSNQLIFDYNRWAEDDNAPSTKQAVDLIRYLDSFMTTITDNPFDNIILRSKGVNILIQNAEKAVLCITTVETINLALISVRLRRAAVNLSKMLGGDDII
ncbi:MAG: hypothetical protein JXA54_00385 [Candidatus Heimdallarchaeota archaeon]|nr:hypothetical protein [Candidatus Heimdallarchaeota archaeon]